MNLAILKKSRHMPEEGDIFVMRPPDGQYIFGRVVDVNANPLGVGGACLIYIYRARSTEKKPVPELLRGQLLTPPLMTNRQPWTKGYFEHLEKRSLAPMDKLPRHCFADSSGRYFDEYGGRLQKPIEPVGRWGLHSIRTIDDEVSRALGLPLAPD